MRHYTSNDALEGIKDKPVSSIESLEFCLADGVNCESFVAYFKPPISHVISFNS
jgi:hypothetical protein